MENSQIIAEALRIVSSRPSKPENLDVAVTREALQLRRQISDKSMATRTLLAVPILATIEKVEFEESSQRFKVTYRPDKVTPGFDEIEAVRSDRADGASGGAVRQMWSSAAGRRACIYKYLEPTNDPKKPSVRVAPFVTFLD